MYSFTHLSIAKQILAVPQGTKDQFNNLLFENSFYHWAKKVVKHFNDIYEAARRLKGVWYLRMTYAYKYLKERLNRLKSKFFGQKDNAPRTKLHKKYKNAKMINGVLTLKDDVVRSVHPKTYK